MQCLLNIYSNIEFIFILLEKARFVQGKQCQKDTSELFP